GPERRQRVRPPGSSSLAAVQDTRTFRLRPHGRSARSGPLRAREGTTKLCTAFSGPLALVLTLLCTVFEELDWTSGPRSGTSAPSASDLSCSPRGPVLNGAAQHRHAQAGR